jgi:hypothetical protein
MESHSLRRQECVVRVTMVNLNESGTIRLAYMDLGDEWRQHHPLTAREAICDASLVTDC